MNFTILSLISSQIHNPSPFFANTPSINMHSCFFSSHFSSILYSKNNIQKYIIDFTSFSFILDTALNFDSDSFEDKIYTKTLVEKGDKDKLEVKRCLFMKCVSKNKGGGIYVSSSSSEIFFLISNTGFYQCKASAGDAFYSQTKETIISNACIKKCEKNAFYAKSKVIVNVLQTTISDSKLDTEIDSNRIEISRINLSSNHNSFKIISNFDNTVISSSNFGNNQGSTYFISFETSASRQFNLNNCNFINNKYSSLVSFLSSSLTFDHCSFIDDHSSKFCREDSNYVMSNCMFSETQGEVMAKAMPKGLLNNPFYTSRTTVMNDIGSTAECWNKMSGNTNSDSRSSSSRVGKIIGVIVLLGVIVGVVAFLLVKFGRNRCKIVKRGDQTPLFYTGL
ncbi:hypothetical protein M9Y10_002196 [Tritrichomonas musculus]|uniref:Right handed beta helix domain-containing protein n=1 Tax=Tritrichomonas musculus TaxID=1915356 RepID=A0ABR2L939_9EUKA